MIQILRHVLRRLGTSLLVLVGVSMLVFAIARVIPGDPARVAPGPNATAEAVAALRADLGLDEPVAVQHAVDMGGLLRGDPGASLYTNRPVAVDVAQFLPATLEPILVAGALMVALGRPPGILAARHRGRWPVHLVRVVALLGVSAPGFVWATGLMLVFSYHLGWFPIEGRIAEAHEALPRVTGFLTVDAVLAGDGAAFASAWRHLALPAFALALSGIGQATRLTRANMIETNDRPYIEMAEAHGWPERRIAARYAFKPSLIPSLTVIGLDPTLIYGMLAITAMWWPWYTRLVTNITRGERVEGYVLAAEVVGASPAHVMVRESLPNRWPAILTKMTLDMGFVILIVSSISFLGLGVQPPTPDLGSMVAEGADYLPDSWWLTVFPGLAILVAVFGFNLLGDGLRQVFGGEP